MKATTNEPITNIDEFITWNKRESTRLAESNFTQEEFYDLLNAYIVLGHVIYNQYHPQNEIVY